MVDKVVSLRIPGSRKIDPCPNCDPKKRKERGLKTQNSDVINCPVCFGGSTDVGREYLPICIINHNKEVNCDSLPQFLCNNLSKLLEIARFHYFPEVDPPPAKLDIPRFWLDDPDNMKLVTIVNTSTKTVRSSTLAAPGQLIETKRHELYLELYACEYPNLYDAMRHWLSKSNVASWRSLRITKILMSKVHSEFNWRARVVTAACKEGVYCLREKNKHHRSPIWFDLKADSLAQYYTFTQWCYPCSNSAVESSKPRKKKRKSAEDAEQDPQSSLKPKQATPAASLPAGICHDRDSLVLEAFMRARLALLQKCPELLDAATKQDQAPKTSENQVNSQGQQGQQGQQEQRAPRLAFVPARRLPSSQSCSQSCSQPKKPETPKQTQGKAAMEKEEPTDEPVKQQQQQQQQDPAQSAHSTQSTQSSQSHSRTQTKRAKKKQSDMAAMWG
jgi:hypothetical protein